MMDITPEEIKWMCEYAEEYELIRYPFGYSHIKSPFREHSMAPQNAVCYFSSNKDDLGYLLQRAIEGVNSSHNGEYYIVQELEFIVVFHHSKEDSRHEAYIIDKAKLSALRYIMEQEKK